MKVLLVEDDIQLNTTISSYLGMSGYKCVNIFNGIEAVTMIDKELFDLYVIDINIPHINGLELLSYIRQKESTTPVVIITASLEIQNLKDAYDYGCSEYIKKPFYLEELEIRIDRLLKNRKNIISFGKESYFEKESKRLFLNNQEVKLRKKEQRLLDILLRNLNNIVPNDVICSYVWENEEKESYPLRQLVSELRKFLKETACNIVAYTQTGYKIEIKD